MDSAKKRDTTGGTVLNACGRTHQTLKIWVHHTTGGLAAVRAMRQQKNKPDIYRRSCHLPRFCMSVLISIQQGSPKIGTISSKLPWKFFHLSVPVSTTASFTFWCAPPEIFLQLSHSWWVFQTVMWNILKDFWWLENISSCFWKNSWRIREKLIQEAHHISY